jgi:hypothetical protein
MRLARAAAALDLSKNDIARHAIRAAIAAVEASDFQIQLPLSMQVMEVRLLGSKAASKAPPAASRYSPGAGDGSVPESPKGGKTRKAERPVRAENSRKRKDGSLGGPTHGRNYAGRSANNGPGASPMHGGNHAEGDPSHND